MDTVIILEIVKPVLYAVLAAAACILGFYIKKMGSQFIDWLKTKTNKDTYDQAMKMAEGLYIYLEDKYGEAFKKMGAVKKAEMETMLLEKFPTLTQAELDSINKIVWASFQEGFNGTYSNKAKSVSQGSDTSRIDG